MTGSSALTLQIANMLNAHRLQRGRKKRLKHPRAVRARHARRRASHTRLLRRRQGRLPAARPEEEHTVRPKHEEEVAARPMATDRALLVVVARGDVRLGLPEDAQVRHAIEKRAKERAVQQQRQHAPLLLVWFRGRWSEHVGEHRGFRVAESEKRCQAGAVAFLFFLRVFFWGFQDVAALSSVGLEAVVTLKQRHLRRTARLIQSSVSRRQIIHLCRRLAGIVVGDIFWKKIEFNFK